MLNLTDTPRYARCPLTGVEGRITAVRQFLGTEPELGIQRSGVTAGGDPYDIVWTYAETAIEIEEYDVR